LFGGRLFYRSILTGGRNIIKIFTPNY